MAYYRYINKIRLKFGQYNHIQTPKKSTHVIINNKLETSRDRNKLALI